MDTLFFHPKVVHIPIALGVLDAPGWRRSAGLVAPVAAGEVGCWLLRCRDPSRLRHRRPANGRVRGGPRRAGSSPSKRSRRTKRRRRCSCGPAVQCSA